MKSLAPKKKDDCLGFQSSGQRIALASQLVEAGIGVLGLVRGEGRDTVSSFTFEELRHLQFSSHCGRRVGC